MYQHKTKNYTVKPTFTNNGFVIFKKPHKKRLTTLNRDIFLSIFKETV